MYIEINTGRPVVAVHFDGSHEQRVRYRIKDTPIQARMMGAPAYFRDDKPVNLNDWIVGGTLIVPDAEFRKRYCIAE